MPDIATSTDTTSTAKSDQPKSWRALLPVHPAAELFPLMPEAELRELGEDIKAKGGLIQAVHLYKGKLLDGGNRLDAMELVGFTFDNAELNGLAHHLKDSVDPYDYVIAANLHRRHLTADQRRDLIAKVLKAKPEASNRQIAEQVKASHPTVAKVRAELEQKGDVEKVSTSTDTKGRKQPRKRATPTSGAVEAKPATNAHDDIKTEELTEDSEVAPPEVIEENVLYTIQRMNEHARVFKKLFKASNFDREAKARISEAIERLIAKWRSTQATLNADLPLGFGRDV
jgi:DNA-binding MarR family transcriptional regulator